MEIGGDQVEYAARLEHFADRVSVGRPRHAHGVGDELHGVVHDRLRDRKVRNLRALERLEAEAPVPLREPVRAERARGRPVVDRLVGQHRHGVLRGLAGDVDVVAGDRLDRPGDLHVPSDVAHGFGDQRGLARQSPHDQRVGLRPLRAEHLLRHVGVAHVEGALVGGVQAGELQPSAHLPDAFAAEEVVGVQNGEASEPFEVGQIVDERLGLDRVVGDQPEDIRVAEDARLADRRQRQHVDDFAVTDVLIVVLRRRPDLRADQRVDTIAEEQLLDGAVAEGGVVLLVEFQRPAEHPARAVDLVDRELRPVAHPFLCEVEDAGEPDLDRRRGRSGRHPRRQEAYREDRAGDAQAPATAGWPHAGECINGVRAG